MQGRTDSPVKQPDVLFGQLLLHNGHLLHSLQLAEGHDGHCLGRRWWGLLVLDKLFSSLAEGELWVRVDGELRAADTVQRGAQHQLTIVFRNVPPGGQLGAGGSQMQTLLQGRAGQRSLAEATQEANTVKGSGSALLSDGGDRLGKLC